MKVLALVALALASCLVLATPAAARKKPRTMYYLSLGDSLSVGIQPGPADDPGHAALSAPTDTGYSDQLHAKAKRLYPGLKLVKAGCGVDLACVMRGQQDVSRDLRAIGRRLMRAAGPGVPVIATTFYDPFLGLYVQGGDVATLAEASRVLAKSINQQTLIPGWRRNKVRVARIDEAFGTYIPFSQTVNHTTFGTIPEAVSNVCNYTWFCAPAPVGPNIHANKTGYGVMADAFLAQLTAAA